MSRIVAFGMGPMRWEQSTHLHALPLRTWHFARTLSDYGHDVRLIALRRHSLEQWPTSKITKVQRNGVTVFSVSEHAAWERPELIQRIVEAHRPEAIVGVNTHPAQVAVAFAGDRPLWADVNGDPMAEAQARAAVYEDDLSVVDWYGRLVPLLRRADRFSTCSRRQQMALLGQLGMLGRLTGGNDGYDFAAAIPNSVDDEDLATLSTIERRPRSPGDPFVLLWSGGYNTWADGDTLFEALERAMEQEPSVRFVSLGGSIAGHDDRTFKRFSERVATSRFRHRYQFPGWVLSEELPVYYQSAHAAILVDRYTTEGQLGARTRMLDWLAAGLPIVTTRLSEISCDLEVRGLALTASCGDPRGLADAVVRLARDPALATQMGEAGQAHASAELRASVQLRGLVDWAERPERAPDGDRCVNLRTAETPLTQIRKNAQVFAEQVRDGGVKHALWSTASFAKRRVENRLARLAAQAGLDGGEIPSVPSAHLPESTDIRPRFGPDHWRARMAAYGRAPEVGVIVYAPGGTSPDVLSWTLVHLRRQYYPTWRVLVVIGRAAPEELRGAAVEQIARLGESGLSAQLFDHPEAHQAAVLRHQWLADADWLMVLGAGDLLQPDALSELVEGAVGSGCDIVYADETCVDETAAPRGPFCKPGWSPDFLLSYPYFGQPAMYRASLLVEHVELALDGPARAVEYDLSLRATEHTEAIVHVPRTLCRRWTPIDRPLGERVRDEQQLAQAEQGCLEQAVWRRGLDATVERGARPHSFRVRYAVRDDALVSIVIPTRDRVDLLEPCVESIDARSTYANREILIVDNGSTDPDTLAYLSRTRHRVLRYDEPFNFSRLNNRAAEEASGQYLLLLNNDTTVISPDWIQAMIEHAARPEVGAVGVKLLWPDGVIQHAGIAYMPTRFTYAHGRLRDAGQDAFSDVVRNFSAVTAACMMMRRDLYLEVGGLDERFAVAYNDVDLCLRLRREGYTIVYTPHATLYHAESSSRGYGVQPRSDDRLLESRWLRKLGPDPYLGAVGLAE